MRTKGIGKIAAGVTFALMFQGCQPKISAGVVTSSLTMTGAAKPATVAGGKSIFSLLLQQAYAFISPSLVDKNGVAINLAEAWTVVKQFELEAAETVGASEVDGSEIEFQGPYYVNLLSNSPVPFDTQPIPAAAYKRIKMKLHASSSALPTGVPVELTNNSIFIKGTIGANNFTFTLNDSTEVNIGGANPIVPANGGSLLIEINLANIFKQINMATVANNEVISQSARHPGVNLCVDIDPSANDLYTCMRKVLEKHADFGEDKDGNHDLDANEDVK